MRTKMLTSPSHLSNLSVFSQALFRGRSLQWQVDAGEIFNASPVNGST